MKVIDLLNKIANDEHIPKRIKYNNRVWIYSDYWKDYDPEDCSFYDNNTLFFTIFQNRRDTEFMNDDVEIIEEFEVVEEEIERLDLEENAINRNERYIRKEDNKFINLSIADYELAIKINKIIDYINKNDRK